MSPAVKIFFLAYLAIFLALAWFGFKIYRGISSWEFEELGKSTEIQNTVPFSLVFRGFAQGGESQVNYAVRSANGWQSVESAMGITDSRAMDFKKNILIGIFDAKDSLISSHIDSIKENSGYLDVYVIQNAVSPSDLPQNAGSSAPFEIVSIFRTDSPIRFKFSGYPKLAEALSRTTFKDITSVVQ